MEIFLSNPAFVWLAVGAFLIAFEALTAPGLGLFLAGLGAVCTGLLVESGLVGETANAVQCAFFFGLTTLWAAILWKPLQQFRAHRRTGGGVVSNVIGESGTVGKGGLKRGVVGQVVWSGTVMNALLDLSSPLAGLEEGAVVEILSVSGTTLNVIPKP